MPDTCATCFFFVDDSCRFDAPVLIPGLATMWPEVDDDDWCADFSTTAKRTSGTHGANDNCANCNFCRHDTDSLGVVRHMCHYSSPVLIRDQGTMWPEVNPTLWCADFSLTAKPSTAGDASAAYALATDAYNLASAAYVLAENVSSATWTSFTPTISASSGSITTISGVYGFWLQIGSIVFIDVAFQITDHGTGDGLMYVTLPKAIGTGNAGAVYVGSGVMDLPAGVALYAYALTSGGADAQRMTVQKYDGTYPKSVNSAYKIQLAYAVD